MALVNSRTGEYIQPFADWAEQRGYAEWSGTHFYGPEGLVPASELRALYEAENPFTPEVTYVANNAGPDAPNRFVAADIYGNGKQYNSVEELNQAFPGQNFTQSDPRFKNPPIGQGGGRSFLQDLVGTFLTDEDAFLKIPPVKAALGAGLTSAFAPTVTNAIGVSKGLGEAITSGGIGAGTAAITGGNPVTAGATSFGSTLGLNALAGAGGNAEIAYGTPQPPDQFAGVSTEDMGLGGGLRMTERTIAPDMGAGGGLQLAAGGLSPGMGSGGGLKLPGVGEIPWWLGGGAALLGAGALAGGGGSIGLPNPDANYGSIDQNLVPKPTATTPSGADVYGSQKIVNDAIKNGNLPIGTILTLAGGASALSKILDGTATTDDWLKIAGAVAPAALGAFASNRQSSALEGLANKYLEYGAPSRARYESSFAPGFTMANDPGYTDALNLATKSTLHSLSPQGNPVGSPNAWAKTLEDLNAKVAYPALQNYRNTNANAGGIATLNAASIPATTGAIGANANVFNAVGSGVANVFNPPSRLEDILRAMKGL